jgi:protein-disulfide isomerase
MRIGGMIACSFVAAAVAGCDPKGADLEEVKKDQREIFFKLGSLDKAVQQVGAQPAAPAAAAAEPRKDYPNKVYTIPVAESPAKGPSDARVTIVEFSDFQCPPCAESRDLIKRVLDAYPKDVRLVYKQFPLPSLHKNAVAAARASIAARRQGRFWEMHDTLYKHQDALEPDKLADYAKEIGLDMQRWQHDFDSPEIRELVAREIQDGRAADVDATPTFFVNGKRLDQRSFEDFKQLIEDALRAKGEKKG